LGCSPEVIGRGHAPAALPGLGGPQGPSTPVSTSPELPAGYHGHLTSGRTTSGESHVQEAPRGDLWIASPICHWIPAADPILSAGRPN
jgi:hypothetical protein